MPTDCLILRYCASSASPVLPPKSILCFINYFIMADNHERFTNYGSDRIILWMSSIHTVVR